MIPDWFITTGLIFTTILMLVGLFYIAQLVIERFLIITLPILASFWDRIKNPQDYK